jgi:hypothetical protein
VVQRGGKIGTGLGVTFVRDILDICGGVIISPGHSVMRFCMKPTGICNAKGHRTTKVLLASKTFYITLPRAGQARFEPSLPRNMLPADMEVEDFLDKSKPLVEWSAYFEGLRARKASKDSSPSGLLVDSWEKLETPVLEAYSLAHKSLKTPKWLRMGSLMAIDLETVPMPMERSDSFSAVTNFLDTDVDGKALDDKIQAGLRTIFAEWNRLEARFSLIHSKFNDTSTGEQRYRQAVQKTMLEMQNSVRDADTRIQVLHAAIGRDLEALENETLCVWEAIGLLTKGLKEVTGDVRADASFLTQTRNTLPTVIENLAKLQSHYSINMPLINKSLKSSRNRLTALENKAGPNLGASVAFDVDAGTDYSAEIGQVKADLEASIDAVRRNVSQISSGGRGARGPQPLPPLEALRPLPPLEQEEMWTTC